MIEITLPNIPSFEEQLAAIDSSARKPQQVVLACAVFAQEFALLQKRHGFAIPIIYLEQKLHDTPNLLRRTMQEAVDALELAFGEGLEILCAYGLCGKGLTGVTPKKSTLIYSRVHDCIPMLLGSSPNEASDTAHNGSTYWLSAGWLLCSQLPFIEAREQRHAQLFEDYDAEDAEYLIEMERAWCLSYEDMCLIRWPEFGNSYDERARFVADDAGLPLHSIEGNDSWLLALLQGSHDTQRFVKVGPNQTLDLDNDGRIGPVPLEQGLASIA